MKDLHTFPKHETKEKRISGPISSPKSHTEGVCVCVGLCPPAGGRVGEGRKIEFRPARQPARCVPNKRTHLVEREFPNSEKATECPDWGPIGGLN